MKNKPLILGAAAVTLSLAAAPVLAHGFGGGFMGHGHGYGHGHGHGHGYGMKGFGKGGCAQALQPGADGAIGVDQVKAYMENRLAMRGNDRLKVGKVEAKGDNTIVAEIVTVDDSLVRTVEFDTRTGAHRPIR